MKVDRNALKIQALLEKISSLTTNYENQLADARVEYTVLQSEHAEALTELKELKEGTDEPVQEAPPAE